MSSDALDKLAYANKDNATYISFLDFFTTELTKKKTQELQTIKEDFSAFIKLEDDKTKILEGAQEALKAKLKQLRLKLVDVKAKNEADVEAHTRNVKALSEELERIRTNAKDAKKQRAEVEASKKQMVERLERVQNAFDAENKRHANVTKVDRGLKEELNDWKMKHDELCAEYEERTEQLKQEIGNLRIQNRGAKDVKGKYTDASLLRNNIINELNTLKAENSLDIGVKSLLQETIREREALTAELSQLIIAKLDPRVDEATMGQLDEIMKELDTIIEYGRNISQDMNYLRQMKMDQSRKVDTNKG